MPAGAVTSRTKWGTARTLLEPVEGRGGVGIEVGYRCCLSIALTSGFALIVEFEDGSRWFDPVVDLGRCNQEAVACQANTPAQGRLGELEDVGVENDRRMRTGLRGAATKVRIARSPTGTSTYSCVTTAMSGIVACPAGSRIDAVNH